MNPASTLEDLCTSQNFVQTFSKSDRTPTAGEGLNVLNKSPLIIKVWGLRSNGTVNALKRSQILSNSALKHCE